MRVSGDAAQLKRDGCSSSCTTEQQQLRAHLTNHRHVRESVAREHTHNASYAGTWIYAYVRVLAMPPLSGWASAMAAIPRVSTPPQGPKQRTVISLCGALTRLH
eukprot:GHVU01142718.1.p3 GENE.GHVU01142718.1~~GHVU01142718.1.p3  ORF type:complete len:104 (-),score=6.26 GHVU01142718.1:1113-1424(-)